MPVTTHSRHKKAATDSKKMAALLIRELSDDKIKAEIPFLEFLKLRSCSSSMAFGKLASIKNLIP